MKSVVYIDGQNFLYKVADVLIKNRCINNKQELQSLTFRGLFESTLNNKEIDIRYYGTKLHFYKEPPEIAEKSRVIINQSRIMRNNLAQQGIEYVESGNLKLRDGDICRFCGKQSRHFQEKGVDVKIAVDMMIDAQTGRFDEYVVVSSDNDLLPAVQYLRKLNKRVVYVGIGSLTKSLMTNSSETIVIGEDEITTAFKQANLH